MFSSYSAYRRNIMKSPIFFNLSKESTFNPQALSSIIRGCKCWQRTRRDTLSGERRPLEVIAERLRRNRGRHEDVTFANASPLRRVNVPFNCLRLPAPLLTVIISHCNVPCYCLFLYPLSLGTTCGGEGVFFEGFATIVWHMVL